MPDRLHRCARILFGMALAATSTFAQGPDDRVPIVFVPGVTGTQLRDPATGLRVWGGTSQMMRPRDHGYSLALPLSANGPGERSGELHPQARFEPVEPMWVLRILAFKKEIYRPLAEEFRRRGWRMGSLTQPGPDDDFFFFLYDWRRSNQDSVGSLTEQLEGLGEARSPETLEVDLICQSNAARICRWAVKYGSLSLVEAEAGKPPPPAGYRIRKLILVGASNSGSLRILEQLHNGRRYIPKVGRKLSPETLFTVRALFEDLPLERSDLFFGPDGEPLEVDLTAPEAWIRYGWSIFSGKAQKRLRKGKRHDVFGTHEDQVRYLETQLDLAGRIGKLLGEDSPYFGSVRYYLLENRSQPTIDRALLVRQGRGWGTYFMGDDQVDSVPALRRLARTEGDGHAPLSSQQTLSPQEVEANVRSVTVEGGHFEMLIAKPALAALFEFLAK